MKMQTDHAYIKQGVYIFFTSDELANSMGHNYMHFPHRPWCALTLNSNLTIVIKKKTLKNFLSFAKQIKGQGFDLFNSIFLRY